MNSGTEKLRKACFFIQLAMAAVAMIFSCVSLASIASTSSTSDVITAMGYILTAIICISIAFAASLVTLSTTIKLKYPKGRETAIVVIAAILFIGGMILIPLTSPSAFSSLAAPMFHSRSELELYVNNCFRIIGSFIPLSAAMIVFTIISLVKKPKTAAPQNGMYGIPAQPYQQPMNNGMYGSSAQPYQQPMNNGMYGSPAQPYQQPMNNGMYGSPAQQPMNNGMYGNPAQPYQNNSQNNNQNNNTMQ